MLQAGPVSHTNIQYMVDYIKIFNISLDLFTIYLLVLVGAEIPLKKIANDSLPG